MKQAHSSSIRVQNGYVWVTLLMAVAVLIPSVSAAPPNKHTHRCATCNYFQEQQDRIRQGKKPVLNSAIVSDRYWSKTGSVSPSDVSGWPLDYLQIDSDRTDSDGDGLRECRYKLDFNAYATDGVYTTAQKTAFENEFRKCAAIWNKSLKHVGLEMLEVTGSNYHILIKSLSDPAELDEGVHGLATLFGAWSSSDGTPVYYLRSDAEGYGPFLHLTENDAPRALYKRPPGNPFIYVYSADEFYNQNAVEADYPYNISDLILHEIGHLMGIQHPFESYASSVGNQTSDYMIDWLAYPTVGATPLTQRSSVLAGEDITKTQWSRRFFNSFMSYDDEGINAIYPDLPAPIKALLAHYYGINNRTSAQVLLDEALTEYNTYSPLANGSMVAEVENNDTTPMLIQIGKPVIGALSKFNASDLTEAYTDSIDRYSFTVAGADTGRSIQIQTSIASLLYAGLEDYFYNENDQPYNGTIQLQLYSPANALLSTSSSVEFPSLTFTPSSAGTYSIVVRKPASQQELVVKDYVLSVAFSGGQPASTSTPTTAPSNTPTNSPTRTPTATPSNTATTVPTSTATRTPTSVPVPVSTSTPTRTSTPQPQPTATPVTGGAVLVFDNASDTSGDLSGSTDFDASTNRNLTIYCSGSQGEATDWHVYVRKGLGGLQYLGRTGSGSDRALEWFANAPRLDAAFRNGPDYNSVYTFRMIRIDSRLDASDIFDQPAPVGFNIEGGNALTLALPDPPYLQTGEVVVYDDILGGNDLSSAAIGADTDKSSWQALQIAWNFGVDSSLVNEYHINVSVDGGAYQFLGQTYSGNINYFWWTPNRDFRTSNDFATGPQGGHTYQFRILLRPYTGSNQTLTGRVLQYNVSQ